MSRYLREQTAGEIVRNSLQLYRQNFRTVVLVYVLITLPISVVQHLLLATSAQVTGFLVALLLDLLLVQPFATAIFSVLLWDVCVGNRPSVSLAFSRVLRGRVLARVYGVHFFLLLLTLFPIFLAFLALLISTLSLGFALFVFLALVFSAWFMLAPSLTVLEELPIAEALRRSKALGKGYYARNLVISFGFIAVVTVISFLAPRIFHFLFHSLLSEDHARWAGALIGLLLESLFFPLSPISIILIYIAMRARKEAYSLFMMRQDLTR